MISAEDTIDGRMELDTCDLRSSELLHVIDMMDMIVFDYGEDTSHSSDYSRLLAVVDVAAADDMAADVLLQPAMVLSTAYGVPLHLGRAFDVFVGEEVLVLGIQIFT